jgi:hypothetical protein
MHKILTASQAISLMLRWIILRRKQPTENELHDQLSCDSFDPRHKILWYVSQTDKSWIVPSNLIVIADDAKSPGDI